MKALNPKLPFTLWQFLCLLAILFMAAISTGCAQLGLQPDTFNKKMAAGYATVAAVSDSARIAYASGKLSEKDRTNVVSTARAGVEGLDLAQSIYASTCPAGSPPTCEAPAANAKLTATLAILTALQAYLATHQGAK